MKRLMIRVIVLLACVAAGSVQASTLADAMKASYEAEAKGDLKGAIKALAIAPAAGSYAAQLRLGWLAYVSKEWNESIDHYNQAVGLAPAAVEPLLGLMLPQQAAGRYNEAIHSALVVIRLDPNNYTAISRMAWLLYLKGDFKNAAAMYRRLVSLYPSDIEMLLGLGFSLKSSGERKESEQCFNTVLLLSPANTRALEGLAQSACPMASTCK